MNDLTPIKKLSLVWKDHRLVKSQEKVTDFCNSTLFDLNAIQCYSFNINMNPNRLKTGKITHQQSKKIQTSPEGIAVQKSTLHRIKQAIIGAGLLAGSTKALACNYEPSMEANINIHEIPELAQKGPQLSNETYTEQSLLKAYNQLLLEQGTINIQSEQIIDTTLLKSVKTLKALSESVIIRNIAKTNQVKLLGYYVNQLPNVAPYTILSLADIGGQNGLVMSIYEAAPFINHTKFKNDKPIGNFAFDAEFSIDNGYITVYEENPSRRTFTSPNDVKIVKTSSQGKYKWQEASSGSFLTIQTKQDLKRTTELVKHNGLLSKFIDESEAGEDVLPKNLSDLTELIKILPSNNPQAYEMILKKVINYRKDPTNDQAYQFRHPDETLKDGNGDCDDFVTLALLWAKTNGFKAKVAWFNGEPAGHVLTKLQNPQTGEIFLIDGTDVRAGEAAYQERLNYYKKMFSSWNFKEIDYL